MNEYFRKVIPNFLLATFVFSACTSNSTPTPENLDDMVLVESGSFDMGFDPDEFLVICQELYEAFSTNQCGIQAFLPAGPIHTIYLSEYYIDIYEVSNAKYAACVADGGCDPPADISSTTRTNYYGNSEFANYPVINVTWDDANTYCTWRDARLPTEAEWEKAARGSESLIYPWGNTFDGNLLNFCDVNCELEHANPNYDDGHLDTSPVGSFPKGVSPYGLYDMAGNVFEWVADWFQADYYSSLESGAENPTGPVNGELRILRGGSWDTGGYASVSSYRGYRPPSTVSSDFGFRCARTP